MGLLIAKGVYVIGGLGVVAAVFTHAPADRVVFWFLALPLACALLTGVITGRSDHLATDAQPTRMEPPPRSPD